MEALGRDGLGKRRGISRRQGIGQRTGNLVERNPLDDFYSDLFPIEIEFKDEQQTVEIRGQFFDEVRMVYMVGRDHPPASTRFHLGHSIGRWEGDTLVVDTRNFTGNRSPGDSGETGSPCRHGIATRHINLT